MRHKDRLRQDSADFETVFHAEGGSLAELEALELKALLEANGIAAVIVGDPVFPNLPFELKVPSAAAERARRLIVEAERRPARATRSNRRANEES